MDVKQLLISDYSHTLKNKFSLYLSKSLLLYVSIYFFNINESRGYYRLKLHYILHLYYKCKSTNLALPTIAAYLEKHVFEYISGAMIR